MNESIGHLVHALAESGASGTRAAGQLMTVLHDHPELLPELLACVPKHCMPDWILGITGAPRTGKSKLVGCLVAHLRRRSPDVRVGIVAVDPSSRTSGGAVLGDRIRMMRHAADPNIFIRSLASRGHLGGLTRGVVAVLPVLRLLGCQYILVETIGVGQSEMDVASVVDHVALVLAPGQGDSIQLLKSVMMEVADLVVV